MDIVNWGHNYFVPGIIHNNMVEFSYIERQVDPLIGVSTKC